MHEAEAISDLTVLDASAFKSHKSNLASSRLRTHRSHRSQSFTDHKALKPMKPAKAYHSMRTIMAWASLTMANTMAQTALCLTKWLVSHTSGLVLIG